MPRNPSVLLRTALCLLLGVILPSAGAVAAQSPDFSRLGFDRLTSRMESAREVRDQVSYVAAVTNIARRFPTQLERLLPAAISTAYSTNWKSPASPEAMVGLYEALFAANWTVNGIQPSSLLGSYIRLMIEQEQWSKAGDAVQRLRAPEYALALMSDRRGDPLVQAQPEIFDLDALVAREITSLESAAQQYPRRLGAWSTLFYAYLGAGRYRQILAVSDELLAAARRERSAANVFEDAESFNWIHDHRARAWMGLGDWDSAEREFRLAASLSELGRTNISNALNLANLLAEKGDEKATLEVLDLLSKHKDRISTYGQMTAMRARHIAALSSRNLAASTEALEYLRKNRDAAPDMLLEALVRERLFDEAATELDRRLADPRLRWNALSFVQEYASPPHKLPSAQEFMRNRDVWLSREDVQASVNKVGRIVKAPFIALRW